jgi:hypothetical protein
MYHVSDLSLREHGGHGSLKSCHEILGCFRVAGRIL